MSADRLGKSSMVCWINHMAQLWNTFQQFLLWLFRGSETTCSVPTYRDEYVNLQDLRDIRRMNPPLQEVAKAKAEIVEHFFIYCVINWQSID